MRGHDISELVTFDERQDGSIGVNPRRDTEPCPPPDCSCFYHAPELHRNGGCSMLGCACQWDGVLRPLPVESSVTAEGFRSGMRQAFGSLSFAGGDVAIPKPTRADLLLSCRQWSDAVRDAIVDCEHDGRVLAKLERLNAVLDELKEMG